MSLHLQVPPVLTFPPLSPLSYWTSSLSGRRASQHLLGAQLHSQKIKMHSGLTPRPPNSHNGQADRNAAEPLLSVKVIRSKSTHSSVRMQRSDTAHCAIGAQRRLLVCGATATQTLHNSHRSLVSAAALKHPS